MRDIQPWLHAGYALFAREGLAGLKVEVLARRVGKSKSSFYHHFAEMEVFLEPLLGWHLVRARHLAEAEAACEQIDPDLVQVLVQAKEDLLFHRQLRVYRERPDFSACLAQADAMVRAGLLPLWARSLGLSANLRAANGLLDLALENFYIQLTEETLTEAWLSAYFKDLHHLVAGIQRRPGAASR